MKMMFGRRFSVFVSSGTPVVHPEEVTRRRVRQRNVAANPFMWLSFVV
jgi:hypothetical protein